MKARHLATAIAAATFLLAAAAQAAPQSKFEKFLNKIDKGLSTVTGQASPASTLSVKTMSTGISPVQSGNDDKSVMSGNTEIRFMQGRTDDQVMPFNAALPVIDKTVGIVACMKSAYGSDAEKALTILRRYTIEGGARYFAGYNSLPMPHVKYHDNNLCMAIKKIEVTVPAPTAVALKLTFIATDSLETTTGEYLYQRDYHGEWQLAEFVRSFE